MSLAVLSIFIPTFFLVSLTPGMCMTLALTLGMTVGLRRTFYMMWGELIGVATVSILAVLGVAAVMLNYPKVFEVFKWLGGAYLFYLGIMMWRSTGKMAISHHDQPRAGMSGWQLALQGFLTAVANPKGWAFTISLLPPFIDTEQALAPQLTILIAIILCTEFLCMTAYATGGSRLRLLLQDASKVALLNKVAGLLMMAVAIWLALG